MDVDAAFPAGAESAELVRPGERPLDGPALAAEAGAVGFPAAGDGRGDPAGRELAAVLHVVVGPAASR